MFAKLGDYLTENNIQRPTRYISPSGEEFVVMPARDYTLLTGLDTDTLPVVESFDILTSTKESDHKIGKRGEEALPDTSGGNISALAHLRLEEEIRIEDLPL